MFLFTLIACALFITPEEGDYTLDVYDVDSNSACDDWGIDAESARDIDSTEVDLSADGESMEFGLVDCDLFGLDFDCFHEERESVDGYDVDVVTTIEIEGTWTSSMSFEADWEMSFDCSGSECGGLDTCRVTFRGDGELD